MKHILDMYKTEVLSEKKIFLSRHLTKAKKEKDC